MAIAELHREIIQTHILTRLDGQTLSAAACVSSQLRSLCSDDDKLWSDICSTNWPSTDHPLVRQAISDFPSGHRSFFSDSFPSPSHHLTTTPTPSPPQIISAVDLRYHGELVFSKAESMNTASGDWFRSSPFRIDLLEPKEIVPSAVKFSGDDRDMQSDLEENITLSWIVIDPTRNRAVNVSSEKPVSVQRNWLTDDIELTFVVVAVRSEGHHDEEHVSCNIEVTCGVKEESGEVYVSGVGLTVQDLDGKCLSGEGSMVILQGLTAGERLSRRYGGGGEDRKERYEEFVKRGRERREERERRERRLDMVCIASGMAFLMAFWSFALW